MLTCLVPVLFTFNIQNVLRLKKNNSGAKGLIILEIYSWNFRNRIFFGGKAAGAWRWLPTPT